MKAIYLVLFCSLVVIYACKKENYETKPKIEVRSVSSKVISVGDSLVVVLDFFDKEGDVDDLLYIWKVRTNQIVRPTVRDSIPARKIPEFPNKQKGEIRLGLAYQEYLVSAQSPRKDPLTGRLEPDTLNMKILIQDKAGNKSDTAYINGLVILRD